MDPRTPPSYLLSRLLAQMEWGTGERKVPGLEDLDTAARGRTVSQAGLEACYTRGYCTAGAPCPLPDGTWQEPHHQLHPLAAEGG